MTAPPWSAIAALVDPVRRSLYEYVRRQDHAVTREEAAAALSISRHLTAFHLDKLVDAGLLRARYESPADQPRGRGRSPKVYEPDGDGLAVLIPSRHYEVIGQILADAVVRSPHDVPASASRGAFEYGRELATRVTAAPDAALSTVLTDLGFEPAGRPPGDVVLRNCPFRALAQRHPELICGLNLALVRGALAGVGSARSVAVLDPGPDRCCVVLRPAA